MKNLQTLLTCTLAAGTIFILSGCDQDSETTLRIGTYNILHGAEVNLDMSIIAKDVIGNNLDIVGFQEIDQKTGRVKGLDTLKALSEASGYAHYAFARGIDLQGGEYGTGILSKYPILKFEVIPLQSGKHEQRSLGHAVIDIQGKHLDFFNTHLSFEDKETRTAQFETLRNETAKCNTFLLTGDFNTADTNEFTVIPNSSLANPNKYPTFPSSKESIDNIVYSNDFTVTDSGMGPEDHSDHNMLWAELLWTPKKK